MTYAGEGDEIGSSGKAQESGIAAVMPISRFFCIVALWLWVWLSPCFLGQVQLQLTSFVQQWKAKVFGVVTPIITIGSLFLFPLRECRKAATCIANHGPPAHLWPTNKA